MKLGISRQALVAALFGAAAIGSLSIAPQILSPEAGAQPIAIQPPAGAPMSFADLIERVEPAVVSVNVVSERKVNDLGDMQQFFEQFRGLPGWTISSNSAASSRKKRVTSRRPRKPARWAQASSFRRTATS